MIERSLRQKKRDAGSGLPKKGKDGNNQLKAHPSPAKNNNKKLKKDKKPQKERKT